MLQMRKEKSTGEKESMTSTLITHFHGFIGYLKWKASIALFLIFNTCVYQKLANIKIYNEFEYGRNDDDLIKVLNSSLINLQGIDPLKEFVSSSVCQRLNGVIAPLMMKLKEDDYIVDFITSLIKMKDCLLLELTVFMTARKVVEWETTKIWLKILSLWVIFWLSQMFLTIERREQCALMKAFYSIRSLKYLEKNCEKWRFNLQTNRVCLVHEPKYLFIVNK